MIRNIDVQPTAAWDGVSALIPAVINIICDDVTDLPNTLTFVSGYTAVIGSEAHVVSNQLDYEMKSDGTWVQKQSQDLVSIITDLSRLDGEVASLGDDVTDLFSAVGDIKDAVKVLVDNGAKNKLKIDAVTTTTNGIQFTINADGSVTADGVNPDKKATGAIYFQLGNVAALTGEKIHISGCPANGSYSSSYAFYIDYQGGSTLAYDEGNGADTTMTSDRTLRCRIIIRSGAVIDNLTFYPMVCDKELDDISHAFKIYSPTNRELYELIRGYHP